MAKKNITQTAALAATVASAALVVPSAASAALSPVGPPLSKSPSVAKGQIQDLVQHDMGVQNFLARQLFLSASVFDGAEVVGIKKTRCKVGSSEWCKYNTGKNGVGTLRTTTFRKGTWVDVYVVTLQYEKGKTVKVTLIIPCSNILGAKKVGHTKQPVSPKKKPVSKIKVSAAVNCNGASASASVSVVSKMGSWTSFRKLFVSASPCIPVAPVPTPPPSTGPISQGDKPTLTAEQECTAKGSNWKWNDIEVKCEINQNSSTGGDSGTTGNGSNTGGSTGGGGSQGGGGSGGGGNAGNCSSQGGTGGGAGGTTGSGSGGNGGAGGNAGNVDCSTNTSGNCNAVNSPGAVINCPGGTTPTPPPTPINQMPKCSPYKVPEHVYPNGGFAIEVSCEDPDGDVITVTHSVRRGKLVPLSQSGTTYRYQYTAPPTVGDDTVTFRVKDSKGLAGEPLAVTFDNPYNER